MNNLLLIIDEMQGILGICPCCGEIFRLTEAKLSFPQKKLKPSQFGKYLDNLFIIESKENKLSKSKERLWEQEEKHALRLKELKEKSINIGRRKAKTELKKIDPHFSGRNIDPQDVKVIFDPVEYIVFNNLNSERPINSIELINREPNSKREENIVNSIRKTITKGNYGFEILQIDKNGNIKQKK